MALFSFFDHPTMKVPYSAFILATLLSNARAGFEYFVRKDASLSAHGVEGDDVTVDNNSMSHPSSKSLITSPNYFPEGLFNAAAPTAVSSKSSKATSSKVSKPSRAPSFQPSSSSMPSLQPSTSSKPSLQPSFSSMPSLQPSISAMPSLQPSLSAMPSLQPSVSSSPSLQPSASSFPSLQPSISSFPSLQPSDISITTFVIRGPVDGQILVGGPGYGSIQDTFNKATLNPPFLSGVTPFDTYMASHSYIFSGLEWFSEEGSTEATVLYDLGNEYTISGLALWNEETNDSMQVTLYSSTDGTTFTNIISFTPTNNPQDQDYFNEMITFSPVVARFIKYEMVNCLSVSFQSCAIGEVAFRSST